MLKGLKIMTHRLRRTSTSRKLTKRKFRLNEETDKGHERRVESASASSLGGGTLPPPYPEGGIPGIIITENIRVEIRPDRGEDTFENVTETESGSERRDSVETMEDHILQCNDVHDVHILEAIPEELLDGRKIDHELEDDRVVVGGTGGVGGGEICSIIPPSPRSSSESSSSLGNYPIQNPTILAKLVEKDMDSNSTKEDEEDKELGGDSSSVASIEVFATPTGSKVSLTSENSIIELGRALSTINPSEPNLGIPITSHLPAPSPAPGPTLGSGPIRPPRPPTLGLSDLSSNQYSNSVLSWPLHVPHDNDPSFPPVRGKRSKHVRHSMQDVTFEHEFPTRRRSRSLLQSPSQYPHPHQSYLQPNYPHPHRPHILNGGTWLLPVSVLTPTIYPFEYQFGGLIGEGGFGKVLLALHIGTYDQYAMKVIALRRIRSRKEAASISNEVRVLRRLREAERAEIPFLACAAPMKDWLWQYRGNVHMVLNYYAGGDLGRGADTFPELRDPRHFKLMAAEVVIAILVLHDMGIVHHDVKPTNILVDSDGHCVLTDYGGSCFISPPTSRTMRTSIPTPPATLQTHHMHNIDDIGEKTHQSYRDHRNRQQEQEKQEQQQQEQQSKHVPIITLRYAAPEVLLNGRDGQVIDYASDFWSLGVTLFELASGQDLIEEMDDEEAARRIQTGQIDMDRLILASAYPGLRALLNELLVFDPTKRLRGHAIRSHPYFSEFLQRDWTSIFSKYRPPFMPNRQAPVNPRNTSYEVIERPGERLLEDADEEVVNLWLEEGGVRLKHHRASEFHRTHGRNARLGIPEFGPGVGTWGWDWNGDWERDQGESGVGRNTEKRQRNRGRRRGNEGGVTEHESVWWT